MSRFSSVAPQIGAALGAGLMVVSAVAFQVGARGGDASASPPPLQRSDDQRAVFPLFVAPVSRLDSAPARAAPEPADTGVSELRPRLAVIIDDVADLATARRIWSLSNAITLAVLPYSDDAPAIADAAGERELFLHLPMEPVGLEDPGPNALTKALEGDRLSARLEWALSRVPGAVGFNNHMGSRMTADEAAMVRLFAALDGHQDGLIFVDSLTHPESVAGDAASAAGFQARNRDVFLDHDPAPDAVERQLEAALELAASRGYAIAIGHPREATLTVLETLVAKANAAGVELVPVTDLARG